MADITTPISFTENDTKSDAVMLRDGNLIAGVTVRVKVSEDHNISSEPTQLAMESGALVTDHVILKPMELSITCEMTNAGDMGASAATDAFEAFTEMIQKREPVEVVTEHYLYTDMILKGFRPLHQAPYKGALNIILDFQQIYRVQLQTVGRMPSKLKGTAKKTGSATQNEGEIDAQPIKKSRLSILLDKATEKVN